ncbi:hypothetical protein M422DRAFT_274382 [Sphaerobolus stellatus SS14]|uniref:Uncharacterized protein n=1 Tax=Sphaerobolus stellatus (strain SS14) TaxID=990650 RepID=A0A0C9UHS3_SPHS4|nr:hypothetical protein M422DRAFT_274382 [Sphaerobolus stellatus SS14]
MEEHGYYRQLQSINSVLYRGRLSIGQGSESTATPLASQQLSHLHPQPPPFAPLHPSVRSPNFKRKSTLSLKEKNNLTPCGTAKAPLHLAVDSCPCPTLPSLTQHQRPLRQRTANTHLDIHAKCKGFCPSSSPYLHSVYSMFNIDLHMRSLIFI